MNKNSWPGIESVLKGKELGTGKVSSFVKSGKENMKPHAMNPHVKIPEARM